MMIRNIKCAQCGTTEIKVEAMQFDRQGTPLGVYPLYYVGNPVEAHLAEHYFCGLYCSNDWFRERREEEDSDATQGTDE